jgi:hypothetical protein
LPGLFSKPIKWTLAACSNQREFKSVLAGTSACGVSYGVEERAMTRAAAPPPTAPCWETSASVIASHQLFCLNVFSMTSLATLIMRPPRGFFYLADFKRFVRGSRTIDISGLNRRSTTAMKVFVAMKGPRPAPSLNYS